MSVLAQAAPADTSNAVLYTVTSRVILNKLIVCNNTAGPIAARVFLDNNGTTATTATALFYDKSVLANNVAEIDFDETTLSTPAGTITVRSATGDALSFTLFGEEDQ